LLAIAHGVCKNKIILILLLTVLGVELLSDISGLFRPENLGLLLSSKDIEAFFTIQNEIEEVLREINTYGEALFKHSPNGDNIWIGRPFCKCEPFCRQYRSNDAFGLKVSREVTYSVAENYPDDYIEFDKMWNSLVESEQQNANEANSPIE
jgi:hypothetical protein